MPFPKGDKRLRKSVEKGKQTRQHNLLSDAKQKYKGKQSVGKWGSYINWDSLCLKRINNRTRRFVFIFCGKCKTFRYVNFHNLIKQMRKPFYTGCCKDCVDNMSWLEQGRARPIRRKPVRGYIKIYMPEDPMADKRGEVYEHRLVMSKIIERPLKNWEIVHHINGIRDDNSPKNLELYPKNSKNHLVMDLMRRRINKLESLLNHHNIPIP